MKLTNFFMAAALGFLLANPALAETRVTFKSAKTTSSYYQMAVQLAEAIKKGTDGAIIVTVEESQGSVQNVKEAAKRTGNYVFTTPPVLVKLAQKGKAMFKGKTDPKYNDIRALFPIPSLTKTYWEQKDAMGADAAWWNGVSGDMLSNIYGKLHPGALKYYDEAGIPVPDALR